MSNSELASPSPEKAPHFVLPNVFAFAPNRDTLGGTAYFIVSNIGNILIDAPAWNDTNRNFITNHGGIKHLIVTHRGGLGQMAIIAKEVVQKVIIQEQEAYLLPETPTIAYHQEYQITDSGVVQQESLLQAIWTPGHSPGSACIYYLNSQPESIPLRGRCANGMLFTGRHLLPVNEIATDGNRQIVPQPLQTAKTFHWPRQQRSVSKLKALFPHVRYLLPGANTGLLRGQGYIDLQGKEW
jgi:glyoxylase-like metal-dependent hydrolase (beta-lactamase superfamily II)